MKLLSALFMVVAVISLGIAVILGLIDRQFPLGSVPANSILNFAQVCVLFSIALSLFYHTTKS